MKSFLVVFATVFSFSALCCQTKVFPRIHLEDDYRQRVPLLSAIDNNVNSIEIDVHLVNGELLVSNKYPSPRHKKTLEQLYLIPLQQIVKSNGGWVYKGFEEPFDLVIDIKTEAGLTFDALNKILVKYENVLTIVENGVVHPRGIRILLAGNRPVPHLWNQRKRLMAIWGSESDVSSGYPSHFMPVISADFLHYSNWNGNGKVRDHETNWLIQFCDKVHDEGKKVHFYSYPEKEIVWDKLLECGVDLINTRKPKKVVAYFKKPKNLVNDIPVAIVRKNSEDERIEKNDSVEITMNPTAQDTVQTEPIGYLPVKQPEIVLRKGHAHNDYEHPNPLYDAISHGFTSLEVDIHLINNELYVSHDLPQSTDSLKTLDALYLKPLSEIVKKNDGAVYRGSDAEFYLMIDIKSDAVETYNRLKEILKIHSELFSRVENGAVSKGPITIILSGNRPIDQLKGESTRMVFIDGRPGELQMGYSPTLMPLISDRFSKHFQWNGIGEMPSHELEYLNRLVQITHEEGKKIRFWASPENVQTWDVLFESGVDLINTDKLENLSQFLAKKGFQP